MTTHNEVVFFIIYFIMYVESCILNVVLLKIAISKKLYNEMLLGTLSLILTTVFLIIIGMIITLLHLKMTSEIPLLDHAIVIFNIMVIMTMSWSLFGAQYVKFIVKSNKDKNIK